MALTQDATFTSATSLCKHKLHIRENQERTLNAPTRSNAREGLAIEAAAGQIGRPVKAGKSGGIGTRVRDFPAIARLMVHVTRAVVRIGRIWPIPVVICGLGLSAVWVCLLGYVLFSLIMLAF